MRHIIVLFALFVACFAVENRQRKVDLGFPKQLKATNLHVQYEGSLKTSASDIPLTGEMWFHSKPNRVELLDNVKFNVNGKKWNLKHLMLVDVNSKKINAYLVVNNKCLPTVYSEDQDTFPRISDWKEIGNNKFERTITNRFALNDVLQSKADLGILGNQEHELRLRLRITLNKNKLQHAETAIWIDGQQIAVKSTDISRVLDASKIDESIFEVPSVCRSAERAKQLKVQNIAMFFLGFVEGQTGGQQSDMDDSKNRGRMSGSDDDDEDMNRNSKNRKNLGKSSFEESEMRETDSNLESDKAKDDTQSGEKISDSNKMSGKNGKLSRDSNLSGKSGSDKTESEGSDSLGNNVQKSGSTTRSSSKAESSQ